MTYKFSIILAIVGMSLAVFGAKAAAIHERRHSRSRGHVARLQDTVDQLLLRQETDHILLQNLQKALLELQNNTPQSLSSSSGVLASVKAEGQALTALGERMKEMRGTMTEALKAQQRLDDVDLLRQEIAYLRSEVQHLKSVKALEGETSAAQVRAHEQREAVTAAWVVDNVKRLQESVVDLQQSLNVSQAMHDKQEVESRLMVVTKDVRAIRGTMAGVTSKAESAAATSQTLQEELTRVTEDVHQSVGQLAALKTEVSSIREDFNALLSALPDGIMSKESNSDSKSIVADDISGKINSGISEIVEKASMTRQTEKLSSLEHRADQLDFALTQVQKQLSLIAPSPSNGERLAELAESERELETRVEAAASGVGEVKTSSVQLLAALDALEARLEKEVSEVKQEVAKLEFSVAQATADRKVQQKDDQTVHDDTSALRSDFQAISRRLDQIILRTADLEGQRLETGLAEAQCRTQHLSIDVKLSDILDRLEFVEEHFRKFQSHHSKHNGSGSIRKRHSSHSLLFSEKK